MSHIGEIEAEMEIEEAIDHEIWLEEQGYHDEEAYALTREEEYADAHSDAELSRRNFQESDEECGKIYTKIRGVTYDNRQAFIKELSAGDLLFLKRETDNPYDENAIAFFNERGYKLGYISKNIARWVAPMIDDNIIISAMVQNITGGSGLNYGVDVLLKIRFN